MIWPYIPPCYLLLSHLFLEEVDIQRHAQDAECKSQDHSCKTGNRVFGLPKLQQLLMPQRMMAKEEETLWLRLDLEIGEVLAQGVPPPDVQMEDVGWRVRWGPELVLA